LDNITIIIIIIMNRFNKKQWVGKIALILVAFFLAYFIDQYYVEGKGTQLDYLVNDLRFMIYDIRFKIKLCNLESTVFFLMRRIFL